MSRLRNPTSASTSATDAPRCASAVPRLAVVVVLPTPPFPDVTTMPGPKGLARSGAPSTLRPSGDTLRMTGSNILKWLPRFECVDETSEKARLIEVGKRYDLAFEPARDLVVDGT